MSDKIFGIFLMQELDEDGQKEFAIAEVESVCTFGLEYIEGQVHNLGNANLGWIETRWPKISQLGKTQRKLIVLQAKLIAISDEMSTLKTLLDEYELLHDERVFKDYKKLPPKFKLNQQESGRPRLPSTRYPLPGEQETDKQKKTRKPTKTGKDSGLSPKKNTSEAMVQQLKEKILKKTTKKAQEEEEEDEEKEKVDEDEEIHKEEGSKEEVEDVPERVPARIEDQIMKYKNQMGYEKDEDELSDTVVETWAYTPGNVMRQLREENELLGMQLRVKGEEVLHLRELVAYYRANETDAKRRPSAEVSPPGPPVKNQKRTLGADMTISEEAYGRLNLFSYSKFVIELATNLFGEDVLAAGNMTGASSHSCKSGIVKKMLDPKIVHIIVEETMKHFEKVTPQMIKNVISTKCQNLAAAVAKKKKQE